jgi:membrane protease YdiL (CAAX protease family)
MLVLPYALALAPSEVKLTPVLLLLAAAQSLVLFAIATFLGLLFSKKIGMGLPILENILEGKNQTKELKSILPLSIGLGVLAGILILAAIIPIDKLIPEFQNMKITLSPWKGFLASFYGGIAEEVLMRLFVVSLLVWITFKIKKDKNGKPTVFGIWLSIILAAIMFGLGHLPATAGIVELNAIVVTRAIILNGIGGVIFGWLYWKKGLESAIIAHFSTDIVLHVITPAVTSLFA